MERFALAVMYFAMDGEDWENSDGDDHHDTWLTEAPVCDWLQVFCDGLGQITNLNLGEEHVLSTLFMKMYPSNGIKQMVYPYFNWIVD